MHSIKRAYTKYKNNIVKLRDRCNQTLLKKNILSNDICVQGVYDIQLEVE